MDFQSSIILSCQSLSNIIASERAVWHPPGQRRANLPHLGTIGTSSWYFDKYHGISNDSGANSGVLLQPSSTAKAAEFKSGNGMYTSVCSPSQVVTVDLSRKSNPALLREAQKVCFGTQLGILLQMLLSSGYSESMPFIISLGGLFRVLNGYEPL